MYKIYYSRCLFILFFLLGSNFFLSAQSDGITETWLGLTVPKRVSNSIEEVLVNDVSVSNLVARVGASDQETVNVSGVNLSNNMSFTITGADADQFTVSINSLSPVTGHIPDTTITVNYSPTRIGSHTASLEINSAGAESLTHVLNGTALEALVMPDVIITEVYGGGGNSGAIYKNDFVELYNTTNNSINIGGWSIQYYIASGTIPSIIEIPLGKVIEANKYFLISGNKKADIGAELPVADVISNVNFSALDGKIVLYVASIKEELENCTDIAKITGKQSFKDYVPYGSATPFFGDKLNSISSTQSASRKKSNGIYVYSANIFNDFERITPNPQNSLLSTGFSVSKELLGLMVNDGVVYFEANLNDLIEVYNTVGKRIHVSTALRGSNFVKIQARGVLLVKVGNRMSKVVL